MAQRTSNVYQLVTLPRFYMALQRLLGEKKARVRYIDEMVKPAVQMKILDCGCGPASILSHLPDVTYTGIDINPNHIAYARALYGERGRFVVGDVVHDLKEENGSFDLILVSGVLHHLTDEDAKRLLASVIELVKPGGRIVTIDCVWLPSQNPIARIFNKLDSGLNVRTVEGYLDLTKGLPAEVAPHIYRDFLRIPYDHFCMTLTRCG